MDELLAGLRRARTDAFVEVAGQRLTHADLLDAATAAAARIEPGTRVPVTATPTLETVVSVLAALLADATVVPVPADAGEAERRHILTDSAAHPTPPGPTPAFLLYTSGTTGPPKGVLLSQRAVAAGLDGLADAWAWLPDDVLAHGLPLFHVHGLILGVLGPLRVGASVVHVGRPSPEAYAAVPDATMLFGVPTIWSRIAADPASAKSLAGARLLVSGSAALPVPVFERIRELTGLEIAERYGMSESLITVATRSDGPRRAGWVGVPISGVQTRLRDEYGEAVPHDGASIGRLEVRGATMFDGYLGLPDVTAATWTDDGWFRTGDVAVVDGEGHHRIVGRESIDLIKTGGYRVGAGEVEAALLGHPAVTECAVVGVPDDDLGQRIVAYVVGDETVGADDLAAYVATELSIHKRPREVRFVADLPRNELGKVQKHLLA